ncbi:MAG: IS30 family transposase [Pseudomonadales bacterium]|nr:IS30 family transposase [Pseudomonadales bacterium]
MNYSQLTTDERYTLSALLKQHCSQADIARELNRSPATISREIRRNKCNDGWYRPFKAVSKTSRRRRESRRKWYTHNVKLQMAIALVRLDWSPEQASGWLRDNSIVSIATSTIYRYVWYDKFYQGDLYKHLRQAGKKRRKMHLSADSRGVLSGKRHISERPKSAEEKTRIGHWEIDTVHGSSDKHSIVTIVDRKTKYTIMSDVNYLVRFATIMMAG